MCFNQRFGRCFSYGCTVRLYIVQFPFTLAGNFAVTLQFVSVISTVKRFLCALATVFAVLFCGCRGKVNFCVTHRFFGNTANKSVARGNKVSNFMQPAKIFVKRRIVFVRQRRGAWDVGM